MQNLTLIIRNYKIHTILFISALLFILTFMPKDTFSFSSGNNQTTSGVNAAIGEYEPAVAVRASACLTCHAQISSNYVTDFGYGSPYFFGNPANKNKVGIFNGHIYGDFTAGPGKTSWLTAEFKKDIIVPEAPIDFNLDEAARKTLTDKSSYKEALRAVSLAGYLRALESKKNRPAPVIEKKNVYIGAPDKATLKKRFNITPEDSVKVKYIKNDSASPEVKGIELSRDGNYYTNTGEIICDGDLFLDGILFLNNPEIVTKTGCRIYAAGPVFLQKKITFKTPGGNRETGNLQLVSAEAIFLGVGRNKCGATEKTDPMALRLLKTPALPSIFTRVSYRNNITPEKFTNDLYKKTELVPLEDSSCHGENTGFTRLLLNAPVINSRYSGKFKGLVIAEYALFWQGKTSFEFDPVFKKVPVLPVLKDSDYLRIE